MEKVFGKYILLECIAESHMAKVYRAKHQVGELGRLLAIKTLHPNVLNDKNTREEFLKEIEITQALQHANIIQIFDFGEIDSVPFVAMEWIDGKNVKQVLESTLKTGAPHLPIEIAFWIIQETAEALDYSHNFKNALTDARHCIVHGDLSPHNIMVTHDGLIKLIDFGIAKIVKETTETLSDSIRGKPSYFAPELLNGKKRDARSDLFSLGAVFWELLTGKKLFQGKTDFVTLQMISDCEPFVKVTLSENFDLNQRIKDVVARLLKNDPEDRFKSSAELSSRLQEVATELGIKCNKKTAAKYMKAVFIEKNLASWETLPMTGAEGTEVAQKPMIVTPQGPVWSPKWRPAPGSAPEPAVETKPAPTQKSEPSGAAAIPEANIKLITPIKEKPSPSGSGFLILFLLFLSITSIYFNRKKIAEFHPFSNQNLVNSDQSRAASSAEAPTVRIVLRLKTKPSILPESRVLLNGVEVIHPRSTDELLLDLEEGKKYILEIDQDDYETYSNNFLAVLPSPTSGEISLMVHLKHKS